MDFNTFKSGAEEAAAGSIVSFGSRHWRWLLHPDVEEYCGLGPDLDLPNEAPRPKKRRKVSFGPPGCRVDSC